VSSVRDRQRAAARAKLAQQMAERAETARKRRRLQAGIGAAVAVVLVAAGSIWLISYLSKSDKKPAAKASPSPVGCTWTPVPTPSAEPGAPPPPLVDVGTPPASGEPRSGISTMTITTNLGVIEIQMDTAKTPCTAASMAYR